MIEDDRLVQELEQWRNKYYAGLAQMEQKEKEWRQTEQVLRQCISRLTLAADNRDHDLNKQLDKLRDALRKNISNTELETMIQSLSTHLLRLDEQRRANTALPAPFTILQRLADGIDFPRGLNHKAKAYSKTLAKARVEEDYQPYLQELIALIVHSFDWLKERQEKEETGEANGKGLLGRLFRREETAQAPETNTPVALAPPPVQDENIQLAKSLLVNILETLSAPPALREQLKSALRREELQGITTELASLFKQAPAISVNSWITPQEVLLQLLERLSVPAELQDEVEAIKTSLGSSLSEAELTMALSRIAELVAKMRLRNQGERSELESFLKQLTLNLRELDMALRSSVVAHRESVEGGRSLDVEVQVQMKGIEDTVQWAESLEGLKQAVQERVDTIRRHMELFRRTEDERIEQAEQQVAQLHARMRVLEAETESLRERIVFERGQSHIDPLTDIPNRLAYNDKIQQEYARWKRYQSPLIMTVWDVDHFKNINDTYGHQAGDKALKVIAKLLSSQVRETDFVARYGGEEFVILLPETEMAQARLVAEKIRSAVQASEFHYRGDRVAITISCGLAQFSGQDDPELVFARADAALYRAKAAGRNSCFLEDQQV